MAAASSTHTVSSRAERDAAAQKAADERLWQAAKALLEETDVLAEWPAVAGAVPSKLKDKYGIIKVCSKLKALWSVIHKLRSIQGPTEGLRVGEVFDAEEAAARCAAGGFQFIRSALLAQPKETWGDDDNGFMGIVASFDLVATAVGCMQDACNRKDLVDAAHLPLIVLFTARPDLRELGMDSGFLELAPRIMKMHASNPHIGFSCLKDCRILAANSLLRQQAAVEAGVLPRILTVMDAQLDIGNTQAEGARLLGNLGGGSPQLQAAVVECGGVAALKSALRAHQGDAQVVEWACGGLANLGRGNRTYWSSCRCVSAVAHVPRAPQGQRRRQWQGPRCCQSCVRPCGTSKTTHEYWRLHVLLSAT